MRAAIVFIALSAALVSAQAADASINDYPSCARACYDSTDLSGCSSLNDQACLCQSQNFIVSSITCIKQKCSLVDFATAAKVSAELCQQAGVAPTITRGPFFPGTALTAATGSSSTTHTITASAASGSLQPTASHTSPTTSASLSANAASINFAGSDALFAGLIAAVALAL